MNPKHTGMPRQMACVGLGANLGDPAAQIRWALAAMRGDCALGLVLSSSLYASSPQGAPDQPDFINAVAMMETALAPLDLLESLQGIETRFGRVRSVRNAPRTLDLDLLLYGTEVLDLPELQVPHPRMHLRRFVLEPLAEIAPGLVIPGMATAGDLLAQLPEQGVRRLSAL